LEELDVETGPKSLGNVLSRHLFGWVEKLVRIFMALPQIKVLLFVMVRIKSSMIDLVSEPNADANSIDSHSKRGLDSVTESKDTRKRMKSDNAAADCAGKQPSVCYSKFTVGMRVGAKFDDSAQYYPGTVVSVDSEKLECSVAFYDGDVDEAVPWSDMSIVK
jgi:hypothetical protein